MKTAQDEVVATYKQYLRKLRELPLDTKVDNEATVASEIERVENHLRIIDKPARQNTDFLIGFFI